ncbi:MAG: hypothetical protein WAN74_02055 [Thermoplasmata archaeon]
MAPEGSDELRPIASLLARIGGVLILLGGLLALVFAAINYYPIHRPGPVPHSFWGGIVVGFIAVVLGFVIFSLGERLKPGRSDVVLWSVVIVALAAISLAAAGWFTAIGFIFALIAGLLGILWAVIRTSGTPPPVHPMLDARACLSCGALNSGSASYCQKCGKPLGGP